MYPKLKIDLKKIKENAKKIISLAEKKNIEVIGVTKGVGGSLKIAKSLLNAGISNLADSRIQNIKNLKRLNAHISCLRMPQLSHIEKLVKYTDILYVSEKKTLKKINQIAKKNNVIKDIMFMLESDDKREGIQLKDLNTYMKYIKRLKNVKFKGIASNFCCLNNIKPNIIKLKKFKSLIANIKMKKNNLIISLGNSSSLPLLLDKDFNAISNQYRIGETILLGLEVPSGKQFMDLNMDTFILKAEIVEIKNRKINNSMRKRILLAIGRQTIDPKGLKPFKKGITIIDSTSGYTIIESEIKNNFNVGDILKFKLNYLNMLKCMTSDYIEKKYTK